MSDPTVLFMCTECGLSVDTETMTGGEDCEWAICEPCLRKMPRKMRPRRARRIYSARRAAAFNGPEAMETPKRRLRFE